MSDKKSKKKRIVKSVSFDDVRKNIMMTKIDLPDRLEEGKTISADKLPDGIHKAQMSVYVSDLKTTKLAVIAIRKLTSSWEAFVGYPDLRDLKPTYKDNQYWESYEWCCENIHDVQAVKMLGVKLKKDEAVLFFPDWAVLTYFE